MASGALGGVEGGVAEELLDLDASKRVIRCERVSEGTEGRASLCACIILGCRARATTIVAVVVVVRLCHRTHCLQL